MYGFATKLVYQIICLSVYLIEIAPLHRYYIVSEALYNIHFARLFHVIPFYEKEPSSPRSTLRGAYRWRHLLPDQLPGEHTGDMAAVSTFLLQCENLGKMHNVSAFTLLHLLKSYNQVEVWWLGMFWWSTYIFMCTNHIDMIVHTPSLFMNWGALWCCNFSHMCWYCPQWDSNSHHRGKLLSGPWLNQALYPFGHTTTLANHTQDAV